MDYYDKCEAIMEWAEGHLNFDTDFIEDMIKRMEDERELTEAQEAAIDNIIERWGIEI